MTEKNTMEYSEKANGMLKYRLYDLFYVDVAFIIVILDFYKIEPTCFDVTCQLIVLFAIKERKQILPFLAFFNRRFRTLLF
jgi:hypothetical protein